jgi:hypothetical protein
MYLCHFIDRGLCLTPLGQRYKTFTQYMQVQHILHRCCHRNFHLHARYSQMRPRMPRIGRIFSIQVRERPHIASRLLLLRYVFDLRHCWGSCVRILFSVTRPPPCPAPLTVRGLRRYRGITTCTKGFWHDLVSSVVHTKG